MSTEETPWKTHGKEDVELAMLTGVMDGSEVHEELSHHRSLRSDVKKLLEQTQTTSAAQPHALQAELRLFRATVEEERYCAQERAP
ncbi:hypothetical protein JB92DRAFT_3103837 [Gautieria morchelliformis]|nr:hypothetical protein JB92DRAFT_3103837 [Gautieria morchelliformis]